MEPTNVPGDREGCRFNPDDASVTTPTGFRDAYRQFAEGGWTALDAPVEYGGQGLPHILKFIVDEMVCATNLSLGMYPGLTHGAISALYEHGSDELKDTYLEKLISGEWTGTMCLTEPQCGTDLGLIRSKAEPDADGSYRVSGTKIWITGGEHDLTDNIVHLVLAKLPDAPAGTKGISLFVVPKVIPETGERNNIHCGGLEHKMGIKGSATCVMNMDEARGWLVGEPHDVEGVVLRQPLPDGRVGQREHLAVDAELLHEPQLVGRNVRIVARTLALVVAEVELAQAGVEHWETIRGDELEAEH